MLNHSTSVILNKKGTAPRGSDIAGFTCCCYHFYTVQTSEVAIIAEYGKFQRIAGAGFNNVKDCWCCCCFEVVAGTVSLKIQELDAYAETKTLDNVFLSVRLSIQYKVNTEQIYDAYYTLENHEEAIKSYSLDFVRGHLTQMDMDAAFESKDRLSGELERVLNQRFAGYGYIIIKALVTGLEPDEFVKESMNEINTAKRERDACAQRAEAEKIVKVKNAEAECESMYLSGVGLARQRKVLMSGLQEQVHGFPESLNLREVMNFVTMNMYFDTMNELSSNGHCKVVYTEEKY